MTWWKGWWPSYGINSLDDLKLWVESRLEEMISLQGDDTLADIGQLLGVQALKNADRYLALFGKGDHTPRPADDQLQHVEDVEDALESVVRYLRQQLQPAGAPASPPVPAAGPGSPPLRSWVQTELDAAIHKYIADRAASYNSLRKAVEENRKGSVEKAREMFGRNVVAAALGVKAKAMVSKSPGWREAAKTLRLGRDGLRRLDKSKKIGLEIAEEKKVESQEDPVVEEAARREAAAFIRSKLKGKQGGVSQGADPVGLADCCDQTVQQGSGGGRPGHLVSGRAAAVEGGAVDDRRDRAVRDRPQSEVPGSVSPGEGRAGPGPSTTTPESSRDHTGLARTASRR
jgi:hypothetical protein